LVSSRARFASKRLPVQQKQTALIAHEMQVIALPIAARNKRSEASSLG
jgi:hypothetical protein